MPCFQEIVLYVNMPYHGLCSTRTCHVVSYYAATHGLLLICGHLWNEQLFPASHLIVVPGKLRTFALGLSAYTYLQYKSN